MRTRLTLACLTLLLLTPAARPLAQRSTASGDWMHHGGDAGSTKYAPLDQITPENAASLRIAWRRPAVSPDLTAAYP
jgi:glucose dehydrogenase